jgi:hypothetical protein
MIENHENSQEHDVDAIIANAYGTANPSSESAVSRQEPSQAQEPQHKEYEFNSLGQVIKVKDNDPRLQQWLSAGHGYSQQMNSFRQERESWEKQRQDWEKNWSVYREIDEYAQKNSDWWNHVSQSYQQKQQNPLDIPDHVKQYLDPIIKDYSQVKTFINDYQRREIEAQNAKADQELQTAIKSIQEKYPNLDFNAQDESGQSLERRVVDHAVKNGFPTFRAAFLDYYHDHLEKLAEARGKESIMSDMKKRQKLGLLDESQAPSPSLSSLNLSGAKSSKSWNDPSLSGSNILKEFKF